MSSFLFSELLRLYGVPKRLKTNSKELRIIQRNTKYLRNSKELKGIQ